MPEDPLDEERLARLLRALPSPPQDWVKAAKASPSLSPEVQAILERARREPMFWMALAEDVPTALDAAGIAPSEPLVAALRELLAP